MLYQRRSQESMIQFFAKVDAFCISNTFISNIRLKLAKNQAKAKQHPETELLLLKIIIGLLHPRYHLKIIGYTLKNVQKGVCFNEII